MPRAQGVGQAQTRRHVFPLEALVEGIRGRRRQQRRAVGQLLEARHTGEVHGEDLAVLSVVAQADVRGQAAEGQGVLNVGAVIGRLGVVFVRARYLKDVVGTLIEVETNAVTRKERLRLQLRPAITDAESQIVAQLAGVEEVVTVDPGLGLRTVRIVVEEVVLPDEVLVEGGRRLAVL